MRNYLFIIFCCCGFSAASQDLTGIWRGHFISNNRSSSPFAEEDRYKLEVQIGQEDKSFSGVTYSYKTTVFYGKASCYGTINKQTRKVLLEEVKIIELKMALGTESCIMTYFLQYSKIDNEEVLQGTYSSMNTGDSMNCGKGTVFLRRVTTSDFHKEPFLAHMEQQKKEEKKIVVPKTPLAQNTTPKPEKIVPPKPEEKNKPAAPKNEKAAPKKTPPAIVPKKNELKVVTDDSLKFIPVRPNPAVIIPPVLSTRANELVKTIITNAREISINIYDNGTIDNDTVSVYIDNKLIISRQRLTEKPISIKFTLDENAQQHELVMVAENLGEIPPNTSLMVVNAGSEKFEVRITSNEQKNAVVLFRYQP